MVVSELEIKQRLALAEVRDGTRERVGVEPNLGELRHSAHHVEPAGKADLLVVETQVLNCGTGQGRRERAGEVVVREANGLEVGEGGEDVGDLADQAGVGSLEGHEAGAFREIVGEAPRGEGRVIADGQGLEAGEAGEEGGRHGGEAVAVEVDFLEVGEVGEGGDWAGELVPLEVQGCEAGETVDVGGELAGEGT